MKAEVEVITPQRARELLDRAAPNRNVRLRKVQKIAEDIRAGLFRLTGEAIKLTDDGILIDGEHRLRAVIEADLPITSLVVYGVALHDRVAMDTGTPRALRDHLALLGIKNSSDVASAAIAFWRTQRQKWHENDAPSHQEALLLIEEHRGLIDSAAAVKVVCKKLHIPLGMAATLHYLQSQIDVEDAEDFWHRLESGVGGSPRHPVTRLREQLIENASSRRSKVDRAVIHAWLRKSWNFYREGREVTFIKWVRGGATPEAFPAVLS